MSEELFDNLKLSRKFQNRLTDLIFDSGHKKSELAKIIGLGNDILIRATNVGMIPSTSSLIKIADYFDVSMEFLIGLTDEEIFTKSVDQTGFQERIKELKENQNITEFEIAKKLGFQRSLFTKWKTKNYIPSLEITVMLAQFFKVSMDYLLGRTNEKRNI